MPATPRPTIRHQPKTPNAPRPLPLLPLLLAATSYIFEMTRHNPKARPVSAQLAMNRIRDYILRKVK